jgi:hypothetical protein
MSWPSKGRVALALVMSVMTFARSPRLFNESSAHIDDGANDPEGILP